MGAHGEHVLLSWEALTCRQPCHTVRSACRCCARVSAMRALCHAPWACPIARGLREPCWPGCEPIAGMGHIATFGPMAWDSNRIPFLFPFVFNSSLNFENPYLSVQSSKNHETSSVSFVISRSTH
jgi:hypothetical protein